MTATKVTPGTAVAPTIHVYLRPDQRDTLVLWANSVGATNQYRAPGTSEMARLALDFIESDPALITRYLGYCARRRMDNQLRGSRRPC
jgi:hypothetical protein